jgi:hypothetical protein
MSAYRRRGGLYPSHTREGFLKAVEAFLQWRPGSPEPTLLAQGKAMSISDACGLVWNCTDQLPEDAYRDLIAAGITFDSKTYAGAARVLRREVKKLTAA